MSRGTRKKELITLEIPSEICIKTEEGYFYVKGKSRYKIPSTRVLQSWDFSNIAELKESDVPPSVVLVGTLGFRGGTLIQVYSTSSVYLISDQKKRKITNPDWLKVLGHKTIVVSEAEAKRHQDGEVLK